MYCTWTLDLRLFLWSISSVNASHHISLLRFSLKQRLISSEGSWRHQSWSADLPEVIEGLVKHAHSNPNLALGHGLDMKGYFYTLPRPWLELFLLAKSSVGVHRAALTAVFIFSIASHRDVSEIHPAADEIFLTRYRLKTLVKLKQQSEGFTSQEIMWYRVRIPQSTKCYLLRSLLLLYSSCLSLTPLTLSLSLHLLILPPFQRPPCPHSQPL